MTDISQSTADAGTTSDHGATVGAEAEWVGVGHAGGTGHTAVDGALRALDAAAGAPLAEQIPAYEAAHRVLRQVLATIDES